VQAGRVVTRVGEGFARDWSFEQCLSMVLGSPLRFAREFGWTLATGTLAATTAVALALPLAWHARRGGWRAAPAWLIVAVCLAIPGPLVGLGVIAVFNTPAVPILNWLYDHSLAPIWVAQTIRALPLATLVLWYALRTVEPDLLASATLDGASAATRFFRIVLPQRLPAVAAAWLVALALAAGELDASILVVPPGVITLPIQVFNLIHYGVDDRVAGISLFVMVLFFAIAAALALAVRRAARNRF
jgi:iron(III) transport system permease protein